MFTRTNLGHGVGLRPKHYRQFLEGSPDVAWVEAISENFMGLGGRPLAVLEAARRDRPVVLHGVSLAVGSVEPLDERYLGELRALVQRLEPAMVSDHLCWGRAHGRHAHDLLPLPYTGEAVALVAERTRRVQDALGRQVLLENVSSYAAFRESEMSEWEFVSEVAEAADCGILLDLNNVYVSARNHGFEPRAYLDGVPVGRVGQFHLAGHQDRGDLVLDTHEGHVCDEVWALYRHAVRRFGEVATLIEWDEGVPELEVLLEESRRARREEARARGEAREVGSRLPAPGSRLPAPPGTAGDSGAVLRRGASTSLARLQATVFEALCGDASVDEAAALVHGGAVSARDRVGVYAEMYWLRLRDTLCADFPLLRRAVGDEDFEVLVARHLKARPSRHHSLGRFGAGFCETVREAALAGWLVDLAALEWARAESFVAPDSPVLAPAALASLGEAARLTAVPSLRLLALEHAVGERWTALDAGGAAEAVAAPAQRTHLVVWRQGFQVFHAAVGDDEAEALRRVLAGADLPAVCEAFAGDAAPAQAAFEAIASWAGEGLLAALD